MKTTILALSIAILSSACGQDPLPGEIQGPGAMQTTDAMPPAAPAPDAPAADATQKPDAMPPPDAAPIFSCDVPADDTIVITSCPGICKVCIAQDYAFKTIPDGAVAHAINMAGCPLAGRPDIVCISDCSAPCPN